MCLNPKAKVERVLKKQAFMLKILKKLCFATFNAKLRANNQRYSLRKKKRRTAAFALILHFINMFFSVPNLEYHGCVI
jgi:hypothetical protein